MISSRIYNFNFLFLCFACRLCASLDMCKFIFLNETSVSLRSNQAQHYFEIELHSHPDFSDLLSKSKVKFKEPAFISFEMMSTRESLTLESLSLSNPLTAGMISVRSFPSNKDEMKVGIWKEINVPLTESDYLSPEDIGWYGIESVQFVFSTSVDSDPGSVSFRLMKACTSVPEPSLCVFRRQYSYGLNAHKCNCETCHSCSCKVQSISAHINDKSCDIEECESCWCAFANCKCCYESDCRYECNCHTCYDTSSVEICEYGMHYGIGSILPQEGGIAGGTEVALFAGPNDTYPNTQVLCKFGAVESEGYFISSQALGCVVPPLSEAAPELNFKTETIVSVSVALGDAAVNDYSFENVTFTYVRCESDDDCSSNGTCNKEGSCICNNNYIGDFCSLQCPASDGEAVCNKNGVCTVAVYTYKAECLCSEGFNGDDCSSADSIPEKSTNSSSTLLCGVDTKVSELCSGHGICGPEDTCECHSGYWGNSCDHICSDCSSHGLCRPDIGECVCFSGYGGDDCEQKLCPFNCYNHGNCNEEANCVCDDGWTGAFCSSEVIPEAVTSFISFNSSSYSAMIGDVDSIQIEIMRTGSLKGNVSVSYKTVDETAISGEDFEYADGILTWNEWDSDSRQVTVKLLSTPLPESGEESFIFVLFNPQPPLLCALGEPSKTVVKIQGEGFSSGISAVRVTFLCAKVNSPESEAEFRGNMVRIIGEMLAIPKARLFVVSVSDYDGESLVSLDILPPSKSISHSDSEINAELPSDVIANALIEAIANKDSMLYQSDALSSLGIDPSYEPRKWETSSALSSDEIGLNSRHLWFVFSIALSVVLGLMCITLSIMFMKRHDILRKYGAKVFTPVYNEDDEFGNEEPNEFEMTTSIGHWVEVER